MNTEFYSSHSNNINHLPYKITQKTEEFQIFMASASFAVCHTAVVV